MSNFQWVTKKKEFFQVFFLNIYYKYHVTRNNNIFKKIG